MCAFCFVSMDLVKSQDRPCLNGTTDLRVEGSVRRRHRGTGRVVLSPVRPRTPDVGGRV